MDSRIETVRDHKRGCGWRKAGGYYLMSGGEPFACGRLPIPFSVCPCCGFGIRPSRQPTWVDADQLIYASGVTCPHDEKTCALCPLGNVGEPEKFGQSLLVWIGKRHYPTVQDFIEEANRFGISRRVQSVPNDFKLGETWVLLAHPQVIHSPPKIGEKIGWQAGIFRMYRPTRIEKVVSGSESKEEIDELAKRGITPVVVERVKGGEELWPE